MVSTSRILALAAAGTLLLAAAACTAQGTPVPQPSVAGAAECTKESLITQAPGKLTIAVGEPAAAPWFVDDKVDSGEGFESAVAYAVAEKLGYVRDDVVWTRVDSDAAVAPGPKSFDFAIDQFSVTDERKQAVDFSAPYYLVRQTVVAVKSSKIVDKKALADLRDAKLGAQADTISHQAITDVVQPTVEPQVYQSHDDAKKALRAGQLDGLVVDLPTAFHLTAEITDAVIVGQLPQVGTPEVFGLLLGKDSPLTGCVSGAVGQLASEGVLKQLEQRWLADAGKAPELT